MSKSNCFREFIKYASFNILGMVFLSCYILADTFFVSQGLGTNGLTALNIAIPFYNFIYGSALMIGIGAATRYSILISRKDKLAANKTFTNAIVLVIVFSILFVIIGILFTSRIIAMFGVEQEIFDMADTYLKVIFLFSPAFLLNNVLICFIRNDGSPHLAMAAMISGSLLNVVLDWVFIFPCQLGIFGAAFATGLAPVCSIIILSGYFICKKNKFHIVRCAPKVSVILKIILNGIPSLITELSSGIVIIVFNAIILGLQKSIGVAAYGVIANLSLVVVSIYTGIAQGIQPLLSKYYGANNQNNIRHILRYALITMLSVSAIVYASVFLGASYITDIFNSDNSVLFHDIAVKGLRLYFIGCPFAGFNIIISIYFTSTERPLPAQVISLLRGFIIIVPMAFLLSFIFKMQGVWCTFAATEILVTLIGIIIFKAKKIKLPNPK